MCTPGTSVPHMTGKGLRIMYAHAHTGAHTPGKAHRAPRRAPRMSGTLYAIAAGTGALTAFVMGML